MNLLQALLTRSAGDADGVCVLSLPRQQHLGSHHDEGKGRGEGALGDSQQPSSPFAALFDKQQGWNPFGRSKAAEQVAAKQNCSGGTIGDLPAPAVAIIWRCLDAQERQALRLTGPVVSTLCNRAVSSLQVTGRDLHPGDIKKLGSTFPDLNRLHLLLGSDPSSTTASTVLHELRSARLPRLHTFTCDVKLRGDALLSVARSLVRTPGLKVLRLPNQRCSSPADQRVLCAVVEALPNLEELDLGGAGSCSSTSGSNAISPSLLRRITRLLPRLQHLRCDTTGVPDEQLASLAQLHGLQELSLSADGSSACGLALAVKQLTSLTQLELQHACLASELVGCLGGMSRLEVLALGLCPQLSVDIVKEVSQLKRLQKLAVPFALGPQQLRELSRLPDLFELLCWCSLELDALGLAHDPLPAVTRLVASSINGHGQPLAAWFPGLQEVCLRSCGDMESLSLRSCLGLSVLLAGDCSGLSDVGFAALRTLRGLQRLQLEGASQVTDASFGAVFQHILPALNHITLAGCPLITDSALQLLTACCRRLGSISISGCPNLTDKTLKRLAHCEHLATVSLKGCKGLTAEGVRALAAAPRMKSVHVSGCVGVRRSQCSGFRRGVKVRVEGGSSHSKHPTAPQ